jgi:hypothetical protein
MFLHLLLCCDTKLASVSSIPLPPWTTYIVFFWVQDMLAMETLTFVGNVGNHQSGYTTIIMTQKTTV